MAVSSTWSRLLRIELRRSVLLWLLPLLAFAPAFAAQDYLTSFDSVPTWLYTSAGIGWSTTFLAPLVAAVACWAAGRDARRGTLELLATTSTSATRRELLGWLTVTLWALVAYIGSGVLLVVLTDTWGSWGRPVLGFLLLGALLVLLASALGYALGTLLPWRLLPPLVGIALFVALLLPEDKRVWQWRALSPTQWLTPSDYSVLYRVIPLPLGLLVIWLGGLAVAALTLPGVLRREHMPILLLACALAAAGFGATRVLDAPSTTGYRAEHVATFTPTCVEQPFPLCVHPAYADLLPQNAAMAARVLEPLAGIPGVPLRIEQHGHGHGITPDGTLLVQSIAQHPEALLLNVTQGVTQASDRQISDAAWAAQVVIEGWLLQRVGQEVAWMWQGPWVTDPAQIEAALARFTALDAATQRAWLDAHLIDLRNGEITLEELP